MHRADYLAEGNIRRQSLWIFTLTTCLAIYCLNTVTLHKKGPEKVKILVSKRIWAINHLPEAWICKYISELKDKISKPQGRREIRRIPLGWICGIDPCQMQLRLSINFCLKKKSYTFLDRNGVALGEPKGSSLVLRFRHKGIGTTHAQIRDPMAGLKFQQPALL